MRPVELYDALGKIRSRLEKIQGIKSREGFQVRLEPILASMQETINSIDNPKAYKGMKIVKEISILGNKLLSIHDGIEEDLSPNQAYSGIENVRNEITILRETIKANTAKPIIQEAIENKTKVKNFQELQSVRDKLASEIESLRDKPYDDVLASGDLLSDKAEKAHREHLSIVMKKFSTWNKYKSKLPIKLDPTLGYSVTRMPVLVRLQHFVDASIFDVMSVKVTELDSSTYVIEDQLVVVADKTNKNFDLSKVIKRLEARFHQKYVDMIGEPFFSITNKQDNYWIMEKNRAARLHKMPAIDTVKYPFDERFNQSKQSEKTITEKTITEKTITEKTKELRAKAEDEIKRTNGPLLARINENIDLLALSLKQAQQVLDKLYDSTRTMVFPNNLLRSSLEGKFTAKHLEAAETLMEHQVRLGEKSNVKVLKQHIRLLDEKSQAAKAFRSAIIKAKKEIEENRVKILKKYRDQLKA